MKDEEIKREKRRRRRVRNQILAYLTLAVFAVAVLVALYFCVTGIAGYLSSYNERVSEVMSEAESDAAAELEAQQAQSGAQDDASTESADEGYVSELSDDPLGELVDTLLQDMTIEEMAAGMFIVTPEALTGVQTVVQAGDASKAAITDNPVGGIVYSSKNFKSAEQFTQMLSKMTEFSKYPLFLAVSAECGGEAFSLPDTKKASELTATDSVAEAYASIGETLASYGVNLNLAPVSEIVSDDGDASLQGRTFGSDAAAAAPLVNAAMQAMQEQGVSAALQKFPGTGTEAKTTEELKNSEFLIYEAAIKGGVDCITVSNVKSTGVTGDDTPDSLSEAVITGLLRESLGFDGVVITDALDDAAVTQSYTAAEAAVAAIAAGADVLYRPEDYTEAYEGVIQAISDGTITEERIYESIYRIYRVKYKNTVSE